MSPEFQTIAVMACLNSFLMAFNFLFWLTGVLFLIIGVWMEVDLYKYTEMSTGYSGMIPFILISLGVFIFLIGSFACCCTLKGKPFLLYLYGGILAIIFAMEMGCSMSVYTYRTELLEGFDGGITRVMENYYNETADIAHDFDEMQQKLKCCGNHNASDWLNIKPFLIPQSCCIEPNCNVQDENKIFHEGCYEKIVSFLSGNIRVIAVMAMVIAIFPLIGMILSFCLAHLLNKHKYEQMS